MIVRRAGVFASLSAASLKELGSVGTMKDSCCRRGGPCHHNSACMRLWAGIPRVVRSAGFKALPTWCHSISGNMVCTLATRFATNMRQFAAGLACHDNAIIESEYRLTCVELPCSVLRTVCMKRASMTHALVQVEAV